MSDMKNECDIVWVHPAADLPFVREKRAYSGRRTGAPKWPKHERLIGYAELGKQAKRNLWYFERRVWVLHDTDPSSYADDDGMVNFAPVEGVLPESVQPQVVSTSASPVLRAHPKQWPPTFPLVSSLP